MPNEATPARPAVLIAWIDTDLPQPKRKAIGSMMPSADIYPYAVHARREGALKITASILDPAIGETLLEKWGDAFGIDEVFVFDRTTGEPQGLLRQLSHHSTRER